MNYEYIRVSTREQNEDRQVIALTEWGVAPDRIYLDKQSGKDFDRPQYRRLLRKLKSGESAGRAVWASEPGGVEGVLCDV